MDALELRELSGRTVEAVRQAGEVIRTDWDQPRDIRRKGRIDLVTQTDLRSEALLKERLAAILPGSTFLAEESSTPESIRAALSGLGDAPTWIIDPLDGTTNFAHGFPLVAVSVALWNGGGPVLGVIHAPLLGEMFLAVRGQGAQLNGHPIQVSGVGALADSLVGTGFPYVIREVLDPTLIRLGRVLSSTQGFRRPGSAAIDMAWLACGRLDAFYETHLKPWDTAAGWLLITEAGGRVTQFDPPGTPYVLGATTILASNGLLHESMQDILNLA